MKKTIKLTGLWVPLVTPFYKGVLDSISLKRLVHTLEPKVDGFIPCLSSGEGGKLSLKDWESVIKEVCHFTQKPIFAGLLRSNEEEVVRLAKKANHLPCVGIVIPTLYASAKKNLHYIERIHRLSKKEIFLYNTEKHPLRSVKALLHLDTLPNVVAIKDSSSKTLFFQKLLALRKQKQLHLSVFQGMEHLLLPSKGCDGYVLSLLNTEAELCKRMFQDQKASLNQKIIKKFWEQNLGGTWYISLKAILYERGLLRSSEEINPPLRPLT